MRGRYRGGHVTVVLSLVAMMLTPSQQVYVPSLRPLPPSLPWSTNQSVILIRPPKTGSKTLVRVRMRFQREKLYG